MRQEDIKRHEVIGRAEFNEGLEDSKLAAEIDLVRNGVTEEIKNILYKKHDGEAESRELIYTKRVIASFYPWLLSQLNSGALRVGWKNFRKIKKFLKKKRKSSNEIESFLRTIPLKADETKSVYDEVAVRFHNILRIERANMQIYTSLDTHDMQTRLNAFTDSNSIFRQGHVAEGGWDEDKKIDNAGKIGDILERIVDLDDLKNSMADDDSAKALMLALSHGFSDERDNLSSLLKNISNVYERIAEDKETDEAREMVNARNAFFEARAQLETDYAKAKNLNEELVTHLIHYGNNGIGDFPDDSTEKITWNEHFQDIQKRRDELWNKISGSNGETSHESNYYETARAFVSTLGDIDASAAPDLQALSETLLDLVRNRSNKTNLFPVWGINSIVSFGESAAAEAIVNGAMASGHIQSHVNGIEGAKIISESDAISPRPKLNLSPYEFLFHLNYERFSDVTNDSDRILHAKLLTDRDVLRVKYKDEQGAMNDYISRNEAKGFFSREKGYSIKKMSAFISELLPETKPLFKLHFSDDGAPVRRVIESNNISSKTVAQFITLLSKAFSGFSVDGRRIDLTPSTAIYLSNLLDSLRAAQNYDKAKDFVGNLDEKIRTEMANSEGVSRIDALNALLVNQESDSNEDEQSETKELLNGLESIFSKNATEKMYEKLDEVRKGYEASNPVPDDENYNSRGTVRQLLAWGKREWVIRMKKKKEAQKWKETDKVLWALYKRSKWSRFKKWIASDIVFQNWTLPLGASNEEREKGSILGNWWKRGRNSLSRRAMRGLGRRIPLVSRLIKDERDDYSDY